MAWEFGHDLVCAHYSPKEVHIDFIHSASYPGRPEVATYSVLISHSTVQKGYYSMYFCSRMQISLICIITIQ